MREFFIANAGYWIDEFHLDGLRLDATQQIFDASPEHILAAISRACARPPAAGQRFIVAENEPQQVKLVRPLERGGYGLDCLWNDDFHHSAMVALTGHNEAYYTDYLGIAAGVHFRRQVGYLYQGQRYKWQKKRRGTPSARPAARGVRQLSCRTTIRSPTRRSGQRCHALTSPGRYRAMTALLLLTPGTPMLFQGQEFAASSPFLFFADHQPELGETGAQRAAASFWPSFPASPLPEMQARLARSRRRPDLRRCKLDFSERQTHAEAYALHRDLLQLRRDDPVLRAQRRGGLDGAVLGPRGFRAAFLRRRRAATACWSSTSAATCTSIPRPEPLLAPPEGADWSILWSSEDPPTAARHPAAGHRGQLADSRRGRGRPDAGPTEADHELTRFCPASMDRTARP